MEFNERSGMASSSRRRAIELWQTDLPGGDRKKTARMLFSYENPPGTREFSGSQDSIGIVYPGLNRLDYRGEYWPDQITSVDDEKILRWLEERLHLVTLGPRKSEFRVRRDTQDHARAGARTRRGGEWLLAGHLNPERRGIWTAGARFIRGANQHVSKNDGQQRPDHHQTICRKIPGLETVGCGRRRLPCPGQSTGDSGSHPAQNPPQGSLADAEIYPQEVLLCLAGFPHIKLAQALHRSVCRPAGH